MFIPIGDDNSQRRTFPYVVLGLIAINGFVWYQQLKFGEAFLARFATIPYEITTGIDLTAEKTIRLHGERITIPHGPGPHPLYLTIFTSMFMHGSWMHIIGNMVYLFIFGDQIEDRFGHFRFVLFYILCGVVASLAQVYADPMSMIPCVGASGAIAGVLGSYLVLHPSNRIKVIFFRDIIYLPAVVVLGMWAVMQVVGQMSANGEQGSGIAYMAHIGGLGAGVALTVLAQVWQRIRYRRY